MTREEFIEKAPMICVPITDKYDYYFKERRLISYFKKSKYNVDITFDTVDELFDYKLRDGRTIGTIIDSWSDFPTLCLDAGPIWHFK